MSEPVGSSAPKVPLGELAETGVAIFWKSAEGHVLSFGSGTPAALKTAGLTMTPNVSTPVGTPYCLPWNSPLDSVVLSRADTLSCVDTVFRSSRTALAAYSLG